MDKNDNLFSFCIILSVIALFNVLQAEKKENTNSYPYAWMSSFDRIKHNKDMGKFGSEDMDKEAQEKMKSKFRPCFLNLLLQMNNFLIIYYH